MGFQGFPVQKGDCVVHGPPGVAGPIGVKGEPRPQCVCGLQGETGPQGVQGLPGESGPWPPRDSRAFWGIWTSNIIFYLCKLTD